MKTFSLRHRTPADQAFIHSLIASWKAEDLGMATLPPDFHPQVDIQIEAMDHCCVGARSLIIEDGHGQAIGRVVLHPEATALRMAELVLIPAARGQGIGSAVVASMLAEARDLGLTLRLSVMATSRARRLYVRLGMAETCHQGPMVLMEA